MQNIVKAVEKHQQLILDAERYIWNNPETGYKEYKTSAYMAKTFQDLGYELTFAEGITGFYTTIDTGKPGPKILILAELDSIICPEHPESDPDTGAVHSCGHHAQSAALIGIAAALKEPGMLEGLCGQIMLCAIPAEETLEIEYRSSLKEKGIIKYLSGKGEFLYRGYFDDVDIAFMVHANKSSGIKDGMNGFIAKQVIYKGVAAHAGGSPHLGKNALYAATCGLNAINALRETFREEDLTRVHPIITNGGSMVNAIPEGVKLESYVRGKTFDAICKTNQKVNEALCGAALSMGVNVEIIDVPGNSPLVNDKNLMNISKEAAELVLPDEEFVLFGNRSTASTDMGDLSQVMPVVHPYMRGAEGNAHGSDYRIVDPVAACVNSAKLQLAMLRLLLQNDGEKAKKVIKEYNAPFSTKKEFLDFLDTIYCSGDRIKYSDDGIATINIK